MIRKRRGRAGSEGAFARGPCRGRAGRPLGPGRTGPAGPVARGRRRTSTPLNTTIPASSLLWSIAASFERLIGAPRLLRKPSSVICSWREVIVCSPLAYNSKAFRTRSACSGSAVRTGSARRPPRSTRVYTYPTGARLGQPPLRSFCCMPLRTSWPRLSGIELGDYGHDAFDETPGRTLLHALGHGDKPNAELLAARLDRCVVGEVPREAIDLVHDEVRDVAVLLEQRCHGLEGGAVRGARGLAELGELVLDGPALLDGEAAASLQLGLDRVAALGLLVRGDPDVDDRPAHAASPGSSSGPWPLRPAAGAPGSTGPEREDGAVRRAADLCRSWRQPSPSWNAGMRMIPDRRSPGTLSSQVEACDAPGGRETKPARSSDRMNRSSEATLITSGLSPSATSRRWPSSC